MDNPLLNAIGGIIDGSYFRGLLGGRAGERMSSRELFGRDENSFGGSLADFGLDVATNPLTWMLGGASLLKGLRGGKPVSGPLPVAGQGTVKPMVDEANALTNVIRNGVRRPTPPPMASPPVVPQPAGSSIDLQALMREPDLAAALAKWKQGMASKPFGGYGDPSMFPPPPPIRGNWA